MSIGLIVVYAFLAVVVIATALGMLLSRNSVYSVLLLVLNFATVAVLYLVLGAPYIALAQITVYAGAIMVLFLFVIMLLGAERHAPGEPLRAQRPLALGLFIVFLVEIGMLLVVRGAGWQTPLPAPGVESGSPAQLGMALFTTYSLPFEVTSVILLTAVVGAIVLTRRHVISARESLPPRQ